MIRAETRKKIYKMARYKIKQADTNSPKRTILVSFSLEMSNPQQMILISCNQLKRN